MDNQALFCAQLVEQRSLYPLYPVLSTPLDSSRIRSLSCDAFPDIQIIATDKMKFAKEVKGTLFVSPGPLALGNGGGTYARNHRLSLQASRFGQRAGKGKRIHSKRRCETVQGRDRCVVICYVFKLFVSATLPLFSIQNAHPAFACLISVSLQIGFSGALSSFQPVTHQIP